MSSYQLSGPPTNRLSRFRKLGLILAATLALPIATAGPVLATHDGVHAEVTIYRGSTIVAFLRGGCPQSGQRDVLRPPLERVRPRLQANRRVLGRQLATADPDSRHVQPDRLLPGVRPVEDPDQPELQGRRDVPHTRERRAGEGLREHRSPGLMPRRNRSRAPSRSSAAGSSFRRRDVNEVILSTLPPGISRWLGQDVPTRLTGSILVPVAVVTTQRQSVRQPRG